MPQSIASSASDDDEELLSDSSDLPETIANVPSSSSRTAPWRRRAKRGPDRSAGGPPVPHRRLERQRIALLHVKQALDKADPASLLSALQQLNRITDKPFASTNVPILYRLIWRLLSWSTFDRYNARLRIETARLQASQACMHSKSTTEQQPAFAAVLAQAANPALEAIEICCLSELRNSLCLRLPLTPDDEGFWTPAYDDLGFLLTSYASFATAGQDCAFSYHLHFNLRIEVYATEDRHALLPGNLLHDLIQQDFRVVELCLILSKPSPILSSLFSRLNRFPFRPNLPAAAATDRGGIFSHRDAFVDRPEDLMLTAACICRGALENGDLDRNDVPPNLLLLVAGAFRCTACHRLGYHDPPQAPLVVRVANLKTGDTVALSADDYRFCPRCLGRHLRGPIQFCPCEVCVALGRGAWSLVRLSKEDIAAWADEVDGQSRARGAVVDRSASA